MITKMQTKLIAASVGLAAAGGASALLLASPAQAVTIQPAYSYGILSSGAAPINAAPFVSSEDGNDRNSAGGASSSDGTIKIGSATVSAGNGHAKAQVSGFSAIGGLISASSVTASCDGGQVTSSVNGTPAGAVGKNASVAYGITGSNGDGGKTIIAMQITIKAGAGTAASTINVGFAACAPAGGNPNPTPSSSPTVKPTVSPTVAPTASPTKPPTTSPTAVPTKPPTGKPTVAPTGTPTKPPVTAPPVTVPPVTALPVIPPAPPVPPVDDHLPVAG